jgi:hypothetical protein
MVLAEKFSWVEVKIWCFMATKSAVKILGF